MIQVGSVVKLAPKWSRPEERHLLYGVKELYEDIGRCKIVCLNSGYVIESHIETVDLEMIEDNGLTIDKDVFKTFDWTRIYENMFKPAFVFDGRNLLDKKTLNEIGFQFYSIGQ